MKIYAFIAASIVLFAGAASAQPAPEELEQQANQIFSSVMSPYCPGRLLINCPSSAATDLKNKVKDSLRAGASPDDLTEELISNFGPEFRASPGNSGFGLLAWLVPLIFLVLGAGFIYFWLRANLNRNSQNNQGIQP